MTNLWLYTNVREADDNQNGIYPEQVKTFQNYLQTSPFTTRNLADILEVIIVWIIYRLKFKEIK